MAVVICRRSLFWRCEQGSHGAAAFERELASPQLGLHPREAWQSRSQELDITLVRDEHIGRFNVAVDNQIRVGVRDCARTSRKSVDSRLHSEHALIAKFVNLFSLDVFKNEIWLAVGPSRRHR